MVARLVPARQPASAPLLAQRLQPFRPPFHPLGPPSPQAPPSPDQALDDLGRDTRDIYLNDVAYWKNIPANVWNYYIGGYQVIKKWLSYREKKVLGRSMKMEEVEYVTEMARRLAAIVLLQPALDENYRTVKANTYPWPGA